MTGKSAFTDEEWQALLEAPPLAGLLVLTAEHGGSIRETFALAKAYAEARQQQGQSELLDEIVAIKPQFERERYHTEEELHDAALQGLRDAKAALESKATPEDAGAYREFVLGLARRVAEAHKEGGERVSPAEQSALDEITSTLASGSSG
jgi:hypothetical protein